MQEPPLPQSHAQEKEDAEIRDAANRGEAQNYETEDPQIHTQSIPVGNVQVARGANWLIWVAGCTLVNALCFAFNMDFSLALGMISPAIVSVLLGEITKDNAVLHFIVTFVPMALSAAIFLFLSKQSNLYRTWALVVGALLIAADTLISLISFQPLTVGLHVWALFAIGQAIFACIAANKAYKAQVAAAATIKLS